MKTMLPLLLPSLQNSTFKFSSDEKLVVFLLEFCILGDETIEVPSPSQLSVSKNVYTLTWYNEEKDNYFSLILNPVFNKTKIKSPGMSVPGCCPQKAKLVFDKWYQQQST